MGKSEKTYVLKCLMFSFEGIGLSFGLEVLHGGLGIDKLQLNIKKDFV
jgi:hypothetical protein